MTKIKKVTRTKRIARRKSKELSQGSLWVDARPKEANELR